MAKADTYARSGQFQARHVERWDRRDAKLGPDMTVTLEKTARIALAAPSTLATLSLLAEAHTRGWNLLVEDCPFSRRFLQPVARREKYRMVFQPFSLIPKIIRAAVDANAVAPWLCVTFPDRPFDSIKGSMGVRLLGREYLLSIAETLVTRAPVDRVFRFVRALVEVERPAGGVRLISGEEIKREAQAQANALEAAILEAPLEYLGWESLYSRSQMYFDLVNSNLRSFFQCLLRYCQVNGMALPISSYSDLVGQLSRRETRA